MLRQDTIGYKIRLIQNQIHKTMEAKRRANEGDNLTGMQRWLMLFLNEHKHEDIYQKDLEGVLQVSRATASNMLQLMEKKELVERIPVTHDARLKKIVLTDKTKKMMEKADLDVREMEQNLTKGFSDDELKKLNEYLQRLMQNIGAYEGEYHTISCGEPRNEDK